MCMQRRQARSCEDDAKMPSHVYVQSLASQKPSSAANASSVLKSVSDTHLMSNEASAEPHDSHVDSMCFSTGLADDENKISQCSRPAVGRSRARTRKRLRSHLTSLPLFWNLEPKASHKRASRALRIFYTYT